MAKSSNLGSIFERLITVCKRNLYEAASCSSDINNVDAMTLNFGGPCGTLLRNNILKEWMDSTIKLSDELIFAISAFSCPRTPRDHHIHVKGGQKCISGKETFSKSCLSNYPSLLQFVNGRLPFGLVEFGMQNVYEKFGECPILHLENTSNTPADSHSLIRLTPDRSYMLLHFYPPPRLASQWYNTWQSRRLSWWKHAHLPTFNQQVFKQATVINESKFNIGFLGVCGLSKQFQTMALNLCSY